MFTLSSMMFKTKEYPNPDKALPRADTCFFNIEIPAYTSREIAKKQILFAIHSTVTMDRDADQDLTGISEVAGGARRK